MYPPDQYATKNEFIDSLFEAHDSFDDYSQEYYFFPEADGVHNSNSYNSGLLNALEIEIPSLFDEIYPIPGFEHPVPPEYYGPWCK